MRRLIYTVAAVVALAPVAAITPASAAVTHPAAAATVCDGHEEATIENHPSSGASNDSYWYLGGSGYINDAHANKTPYCVLPEGKVNNNYAFLLRQEGTSNCAGADTTVNALLMYSSCSSSNSDEMFQITTPSSQSGEMFVTASQWSGWMVMGIGGDTPLSWNNFPYAPYTIWKINCIANTCTL
jgi:putative hemolysin